MGWAGDLQAEDGGEDDGGPQPDSDHVTGTGVHAGACESWARG